MIRVVFKSSARQVILTGLRLEVCAAAETVEVHAIHLDGKRIGTASAGVVLDDHGAAFEGFTVEHVDAREVRWKVGEPRP